MDPDPGLPERLNSDLVCNDRMDPNPDPVCLERLDSDLDPGPVCPERLDPDPVYPESVDSNPVNIRSETLLPGVTGQT